MANYSIEEDYLSKPSPPKRANLNNSCGGGGGGGGGKAATANNKATNGIEMESDDDNDDDDDDEAFQALIPPKVCYGKNVRCMKTKHNFICRRCNLTRIGSGNVFLLNCTGTDPDLLVFMSDSIPVGIELQRLAHRQIKKN